ncbi:MAG: hypothetical protein IPL36_05395 [Nigerium sp.]|nr:hypothetical protein [Nigerium sp.]
MKRLVPLALLALLVGCTGTPAATTTTTTAKATTTATTSPTPSASRTPSATAAPSAVMGMGGTAKTKATDYTLTDYKEIPANDTWGPWQLVKVRGCRHADAEPAPTSSSLFHVQDASGGRYQASYIVGDSDFAPAYPSGNEPEDVLQPGECVEGWLPYETDATLVALVYANEAGERITWRLDA